MNQSAWDFANHFKMFKLPQLNATPNDIASKQLDWGL